MGTYVLKTCGAFKIFLFCFSFTFNVQAGIFDCLSSLKLHVKVDQEADQETADKLSRAIVKGYTEEVKNLAIPWLNQKHHDYIFSYYNVGDYNIVSSNDLLEFAALVAVHNSRRASIIKDPKTFSETRHAINSLKALVEIGFEITSLSNDEKRFWGYVILSRLILRAVPGKTQNDMSTQQKQILTILVAAGLTDEKLYLNDNKSIANEILVSESINPNNLEAIFDSGLITQRDKTINKLNI